jgi:hypothetical protein
MLEESLLKANHEGSTAKEDGAKVYRMLELFKAKYSKLVEDKARQAEELILSEEQKLEISKALLDLKLEFSEANEKFQNEKVRTANICTSYTAPNATLSRFAHRSTLLSSRLPIRKLNFKTRRLS